ncbi:ArsR family transcriptional regulator [Microtetraspora sp. NBRC 13810]|uniref:helix-turn-helix transcriptional regulator n=1 Tax=Microtetraspora sp. NBRC 13810 TaxID=3030990 RepID=UPI0024A1473B|nr:transcriptional regulator [Microtetraspora sp. NBRC 13810]GLW08194.1 ArsR family transcriptional regulator [Microtetraspora sp. NBRC 13810]
MDDLQAVAALQDPVRRALYDFVAAQGRDVGRNEAAEAAGVQRTLAAFHLDKLVEAGLLDARFKRLGERSGPGSGRPAKVYRRASAERSVSLPPRDYRTPALVLADVVHLLGAEERAEEAAREAGARMARPPAPLEDVLRARGYEPYHDGDRVRLRNCPFHVLSEEHPLLVCSMNLALCQGLLDGLGERGVTAVSDAAPGRCCVAFVASSPEDG